MLKNIPEKYVFAGYSVRKSLTIMTSIENGRTVYDTFLYTYVDNYLSFYILMEDGTYKNVEKNISVPEATAEDLMSKHIGRGRVEDTEEYQHYDKETIVGVFGLRGIEELMKQVDEMNAAAQNEDIKLAGLIDVKSSYMGMEITGAINAFNRALKYDKGQITVPPIQYGPDDTYKSLIGDEMDYFDFMSNKDSDTIIRDLKKLDDYIDGVGNVKAGKEIVITKGTDGMAGTVSIVNAPKE